MESDERRYLCAVRDVLENGDVKCQSRNGETTEQIGVTLKFRLSSGVLPLLTTKRIKWHNIITELLFFLRGDTDNRLLTAQRNPIWTGNASRAFLDSRGLTTYPEGQLGPIYGWQWRNFNGTYQPCRCPTAKSCSCLRSCATDIPDRDRIDQLQQIIQALKDPVERFSRRLVVTAWNPLQLQEMALPPCHMMFQMIVSSDLRLHCIVTQRSADMGLGVPYNMASYAALTHLLAHHCGLAGAGTLTMQLGSAHIYRQHYEPLKLQLQREPRPFPTLSISRMCNAIEEYRPEDFVVNDYAPHESIYMEFVP